MSDDIVIRAEDISKRYRISHLAGQGTLRDTMHHAARLAWRRLRWNAKLSREDFWALRDINFEIKRGEVVGIIGRNGAGKSTLLKILSRITEPTTGRISLRGRVASLLEVGTGFHPELTGRDNIFLNGAILGMSRVEIRKKFDEIVAFAEVERFLDTPVKRYSSGMYVRLAFAVAAHLEPEILIVDEVLAVGDQQFQDKCLGKIKSVAHSGRTVLFVSHNLATMQVLCSRVINLRKGSIAFDGEPTTAVNSYLAEARLITAEAASAFHGQDPALAIRNASFHLDARGAAIDISLEIRCKIPRRLGIEFHVSTPNGSPVAFAEAGSLDNAASLFVTAGDHPSSWRLDASRLANGSYYLSIQIVDPGLSVLLRHEHPVTLEILRPPTPPARRVLEQAWQAGCVQLDVERA